ncbi:hypothetical protein psyc5s11_16350 [Clostridium gelidum]|uniref:Condensation domain-containing protein n=1 Tax=Clostridium gelidum TaxID=704125 RepID=A0ABN6IVF7_9CLOT|nr:condensation domain-containing protein [Clostridium gelidum]BCZ45568.1 hypothetical protein psyc5s11_16350 [Clostridium gelidum]
MRILQICDEQQYIFNINEANKSIPIQISYSMEFSESFSSDELSFAIDKCIKESDVFGARCIVKNSRQYMEFLPYDKHDFPIFSFSSEKEYESFCNQVRKTKINNRDKLYYIFIFSIAGSYYHLHFSFNHIIFDGTSALLLSEKIQKILLNKNEEIKWHPFYNHLDNIKSYNESQKYLIDEKFWEDRFLEISKSDYLFRDVIDTNYSPIKDLTFQTSKKLKEELFEYCSKNNISPHILIVVVLAQIITDKTGCKRFYFEIPIGNRLGANEKNSIGTYEIAVPVIFDFTIYNDFFDLLKSVQKQSTDYYKHKNFDWITKISSESHERKYGKYIPQFSFSYFCQNKKPSASVATIHHQSCENDILPMNLYVSDYLDWQAITFSYMYWDNYFNDEEVIQIHKDIETAIANIIENKKLLENE